MTEATRGRQRAREANRLLAVTGTGPAAIDTRDPNFDSESDDERELARASAVPPLAQRAIKAGGGGLGALGGGLRAGVSLDDFKRHVNGLVRELFASESLEEFIDDVARLDAPAMHFEVIRRVVALAIERNDRARELASRALTGLATTGVTSSAQIAKGFERLFELADDLELDTPRAKDYISRFLARAVADEVVPPAFLMDPRVQDLGGDIVSHAKTLLSIRHGHARLSRVWQPNEDLVATPAQEEVTPLLKTEVKLILAEYLNSGDINEAVACVRRLEAPHFGHEVVKRAIVRALDGRETERAMMSTLLAELHAHGALSTAQIEIGFQRLADEADDLELDTPGARRVLRIFFEQALKDGIVRNVPRV